MWTLGLLLLIAGGSGVVWFGFASLLSGTGAIAGLLAPSRIPAERREENMAFLKQMAGKVVTGLVACGLGWGLMAWGEGTKMESAQNVANAATKNADRADAEALAAAADGCAFQLFGRLREPIVKETKEGFVVGAFLRDGAGPQGVRNAAALALCVHRAGKDRSVHTVVVASAAGSWKLARARLSDVEGWEDVTETAAQRAILQLEKIEKKVENEQPRAQVAPSLRQPEPRPVQKKKASR